MKHLSREIDMVQSGERNPDLRYVRKVSHRDATLLPSVRMKLKSTSNSNIGECCVVLVLYCTLGHGCHAPIAIQ